MAMKRALFIAIIFISVRRQPAQLELNPVSFDWVYKTEHFPKSAPFENWKAVLVGHCALPTHQCALEGLYPERNTDH
jgi:hypothetical protein